jgi:hypothetical protein
MPPPESPAHDCLTGGGEMGRLMRAHDWASTPDGPIGTKSVIVTSLP